MSGLCPAAVPWKSEGYIQVFLDGGLNQQRMGVCVGSLSVCEFILLMISFSSLKHLLDPHADM